MPATLSVLCTADKAAGIQVEGAFIRQVGFQGEGLYLYLRLTNQGGNPLGNMDLMLNKNSFGVRTKAVSHDGSSAAPSLSPLLSPNVPGMPLQRGGSVVLCVHMDTDGAVQGMNPLMMIQIAMKLDQNPPAYFGMELPLYGVLRPGVACEKTQFMNMWKAVPNDNELVFMVNSGVGAPPEALAKLTKANFTSVHMREEGATTHLYAAAQTTNNLWLLLEMPVNSDRAQCKVRLQNKVLAPFVEATLRAILSGL